MGRVGRSATPTAYTQALRVPCPQCGHGLCRDDLGIWCRHCLWCATCEGRGCTACPQPDPPAFVPTATPDEQRCETCRRSVRAGQWPQCLDCLTYHVPPAEIVPLAGPTSAVIRTKRQQWLRLHPGWSLVPSSERYLQMPGTRDNAFGTRLLVVRYTVERGHQSVV